MPGLSHTASSAQNPGGRGCRSTCLSARASPSLATSPTTRSASPTSLRKYRQSGGKSDTTRREGVRDARSEIGMQGVR
eukprot:359046-Chlamydomonas_euryale.AAC.2